MSDTPKPMATLTPESAHIFRITHRDNIPWILDHGLHCANSDVRDPNFVPIGNEEVIARRAPRLIQISPGGTISDYVAFYFTPCSLTRPEPVLSKAQEVQVKKIAGALLSKLKRDKLILDWRLKENAKAAVREAIREELDQLPDVYERKIWEEKVERTYQFVFEQFGVN